MAGEIVMGVSSLTEYSALEGGVLSEGYVRSERSFECAWLVRPNNWAGARRTRESVERHIDPARWAWKQRPDPGIMSSWHPCPGEPVMCPWRWWEEIEKPNRDFTRC